MLPPRFPGSMSSPVIGGAQRAAACAPMENPYPNTTPPAPSPKWKILNADPKIGPGLLRIVMQPGDVIARHFHAGQAETLYILEGVFIDEGIAYPAGTELCVEADAHHGPHTTSTGSTFLAMFTGDVDLTDFKLSKGVEKQLEPVAR
jgi:quercetin dioxygenase-like cupin family protein